MKFHDSFGDLELLPEHSSGLELLHQPEQGLLLRLTPSRDEQTDKDEKTLDESIATSLMSSHTVSLPLQSDGAEERANTQRSPNRKFAEDVSAIAMRFAGSGGIPSQPVNMRI